MSRSALFVTVCALLWGAVAPLIRVGQVSGGVLAPTELVTVALVIGFPTLVLPLAVSGALWGAAALRLQRVRARWWLSPLSAFCFCAIALLFSTTAGEWLRDAPTTAWQIVVTALPMAVASALLAHLLGRSTV